MTHTTTAAHIPSISAHVREETGGQLQATLVELLDLSLVGKQLHWSIVGPRFRPVHEQLDELVESWQGLADTVAERAVALGYWPDGQAGAIADASAAAPVDRGAVPVELALAHIVRRVAEVSEGARERMDRLGELDSVSEDVLIGVVRTLEEQLWMLRSQISNGQGQ